ncbi:MAG: hypothetical protein ACJASJ_000492 [Candidatus Azotimanducaceae bacterium]
MLVKDKLGGYQWPINDFEGLARAFFLGGSGAIKIWAQPLCDLDGPSRAEDKG